MAEIDVRRTGGAGPGRDPLLERAGLRLSWGAIFAGFIIATTLQIVLSILGAAIGLEAFNPSHGGGAGGLGIGAAIWFAIAAIISMFVGGLTTGHLAGVISRRDGRLHGVVMWCLATLLALYFASIGLGRLLGGVFDVATRTTSAVAGAAVGSVGRIGAAAVSQGGGIDFNALQHQIEATLRETGNPALSPDSLQQQAQAVKGQATAGTNNQALAQEITQRIRETGGKVNHQDVINVIRARTGMSQAEAENVATRVESVVSSAGAQISSAAQNVGQEAAQAAGAAASAVSKTLWAVFVVMILSLIAAVIGAGLTAPE